VPSRALIAGDRNARLLRGRGRSATPKIAQGLLVDLAFESLSIPKEVTAKKLLTFKNDHAEELAVYRNELAALVSDIPEDLSIEALRQAVQERYQNKVVPALKSLKRSLVAQAWDTGTSTLVKLSALSAGPASALVVAGMPAPTALIVAAGVSLTATAVSLVSERRKTRAASTLSYLLAAGRRWG